MGSDLRPAAARILKVYNMMIQLFSKEGVQLSPEELLENLDLSSGFLQTAGPVMHPEFAGFTEEKTQNTKTQKIFHVRLNAPCFANVIIY